MVTYRPGRLSKIGTVQYEDGPVDGRSVTVPHDWLPPETMLSLTDADGKAGKYRRMSYSDELPAVYVYRWEPSE